MTLTTVKTIRILLVDDHKSFMDGLAMVINSQHPAMEVAGMASSLEETTRLAAELRPDVILLDIGLGSINSLDFLPDLAKKTDARVLILTGLTKSDMYDQAIIKGARGVVLKNESAKFILKAIEKVHAGEIWIDNKTLGRVLNQMTPGLRGDNPARLNPEGQKIAHLTAREVEIIKALVTFEASTNDEIARNLFISRSTLKNHLTTIYSKLNVKNRIQLLKFALSHNIAERPH